jgi:DNA replication regulator DPB11
VNPEKLRHTNEWGVPTVSADWLWISIQVARMKPFEPYIVRKSLSRSSSNGRDTRAGSFAEQDRQSGHANNNNGDTLPSDDEADTEARTVPVPPRNNTTQKQPQPVHSDSFSKEQPQVPQKQASIPESRTPSPSKPEPKPTTELSPTKHQETNHSALNEAVSGLLKQARSAKSRTASEASDKNDSTNNPRQRRRKPLVGKGQAALSRASSIDTVNEDGSGSAIESATNDGGVPTRTNSRNGRIDSSSSILNDTRFEPSDGRQHGPEGGDGEDQIPTMTQLDYEDPDAVAMREQFLSYAGKLVNKPAGRGPDQGVIGGIRELEDVGWGTGRRTRNAGKAAEG